MFSKFPTSLLRTTRFYSTPIPADFRYKLQIPLVWGHMDAFGHLNNVQFHRYFESARIGYLYDLKDKIPENLFKSITTASGIGIILKTSSAKYRMPVVYPDQLEIGVRCKELHPDRFLMEYAMFSLSKRQLVAEGDSWVVMYDYSTSSKTPIPPELYSLLQQEIKS